MKKSLRVLNIAVFIIIASVSIYRIGLSYRQYNQTYDEALSVAIGMEWLQLGTYFYEEDHPPLGKISAAIGPYLKGIRLDPRYLPAKGMNGGPMMYFAGDSILRSGGTYFENLTLARLGTLPFFLLCLSVVWLWAFQLGGPIAACIASLVFSIQPTVLAHAGLTTNDMAVTAMMMAALYAFVRWLHQPKFVQSLILGAFTGLAVASKFSSLPFLGLSFVIGLFFHRLWIQRSMEMPPPNPSVHFLDRPTNNLIAQISIALFASFLVIWSLYRFSFGPILSPGFYPYIEEALSTKATLKSLVYLLGSIPVPFPELFSGFLRVLHHNGGGHYAFFFGKWRIFGVWFYFPICFILKSPLLYILLFFMSCAFILRYSKLRSKLAAIYPPLFFMAILGLAMTGKINAGVRYVLILYPLSAIMIGYSLSRIIGESHKYKRALSLTILFLLITLSTQCFYASPQHIEYTSELVGDKPETIFSDSDLDWGQNYKALKDEIDQRGIDSISIRFFGTCSPEMVGISNYTVLQPNTPVKGWVAISYRELYAPNQDQGPYRWLLQEKPIALIKKSILLYKID